MQKTIPLWLRAKINISVIPRNKPKTKIIFAKSMHKGIFYQSKNTLILPLFLKLLFGNENKKCAMRQPVCFKNNFKDKSIQTKFLIGSETIPIRIFTCI